MFSVSLYQRCIHFFLYGVIWLAWACYTVFIRPRLQGHCCFYPTCSLYVLHCFRDYSLSQAIYLTIVRLKRCHGFQKKSDAI